MGNVTLSSLVKEFPTTARRYVIRKIRRFNVVPRTEKRIDRMLEEKPTRAPLFDATRIEIEKLLNENPDGLIKFSEKDEKLEKNLEKVYLTSTGDNKDGFSVSKVDPSWEKRFALQNVTEKTVPPGKYTIKRAREFLFAYNKDPEEFSASVLSEMYGINEESMVKILDHVKVFRVVMPLQESIKQPFLARYTQGIAPAEMVEENPMQTFFQEAIVRQKNLMNPFHEKLQRPPPEQVEAGKHPVRKAVESVALNLLLMSPEMREAYKDDIRVKKPILAEQEFNVDASLNETKAAQTGEPTSEATTEHVVEPFERIVKPEDEFNVFEAIESAQRDAKSKESEDGQPPLKTPDKV